MFSPGSHAPPPYPGQGQPSHLQPSTPMFVAPPPKTQRVLHSEAYLKYIEGLNADSPTVSKWDETLKGGMILNSQFLGSGKCVGNGFRARRIFVQWPVFCRRLQIRVVLRVQKHGCGVCYNLCHRIICLGCSPKA